MIGADPKERRAKDKAEFFENKYNESLRENEEARSKIQELNLEVFRLKQQQQEAADKSTRALRDIEGRFDVELNELREALVESNLHLEHARAEERARTLELESLKGQLEVKSTRSKRARRAVDEEAETENNKLNEENERLRLQVLELEAHKAGVDVDDRMNGLKKRIRELEHQEDVRNTEMQDLRSRYEACLVKAQSVEELEARLEFFRERASSELATSEQLQALESELKEWRTLAPECPSPSSMLKFLASLKDKVVDLSATRDSLSSTLVGLKESMASKSDQLAESGQQVKSSLEEGQALKKALHEAERRINQLQAEKTASEQMVQLTPVLKVDDNPGAEATRMKLMVDELQLSRQEVKRLEAACQALARENERLVKSVGQGAYDSTRTKVLHMKPSFRPDRSDTVDAAKSIQNLDVPHTPGVSGESVEVRITRMKQLFRKTISEYKEALFLLFGWKVDMEIGENPQLILRSMFAESEGDWLVFQWNKASGSFNLMRSDYASSLSTSQMGFLTSLNSCPAFLSSLTLHLFESQTCKF